MIKDTHRLIKTVIQTLERALGDIESAALELRAALDMLSVKQQESEPGEALEVDIDSVESAGANIQEAIDSLSEVVVSPKLS